MSEGVENWYWSPLAAWGIESPAWLVNVPCFKLSQLRQIATDHGKQKEYNAWASVNSAPPITNQKE